jgi:F-type H+-transporting ATPase subunit a
VAAAETTSKVVEVLKEELTPQTLVNIHVGGLNLSITNAVVYLWVSAVVVFLIFFIASRRMRNRPGLLQSFAESLVGFGRGHLTGQIGEKGRKYYYLVLTIFVFILTTNLIGLIPKPGLMKPYLPTANINVTASMAIVVFLTTQYLGVKNTKLHGRRKAMVLPPRAPKVLAWPLMVVLFPVNQVWRVLRKIGGYLKSWLLPPGVPKILAVPLNGIFFMVHSVGELFRPVSLSVRLFGNTLAGHLVILVMLGLILEFAKWFVFIPAGVFVVIMTGFEIFVALLQAYIFSLLSVLYIEGAIYSGH